MAEEEKAIAEGGSKVTEVQPSTAETTEPAAAQQAGEPEVSNSNAALDFEKFAEETPEVKPEPPTYEEKRQKRSRNPLTRRISRDLEQQLAEADKTNPPERSEPVIVTGIVTRKKSGEHSKELARSRTKSKDRTSKSKKKDIYGTELVEAKPRITKIFGRIMDVSRVLGTPQKTQSLEKTIKPPSPFLKVALILFRDYFQARESKYAKLENSLRASKMPYSSVQYLSLVVFVSLIISLVGAVMIAFFAYLMGPFYILAIAGGAMGVIMFVVIFLSLPGSTSKKRKKDIESKLPMALGYIATMASADMPVDQILFELGESPEYGAVAKEAKSISLGTRVFGKDIVTALREGAKYSPSPKLSEFLQGIVTTVTSGGNLKQYFKTKAVQYQGELSTLIRSNAESIGILAESYVTVGVAFPLMLIVILGVVASLQSASSGMIVVLYLIDLMIIPLITVAFAFLVSSTIKEIKV